MYDSIANQNIVTFIGKITSALGSEDGSFSGLGSLVGSLDGSPSGLGSLLALGSADDDSGSWVGS